MFFFTNENLLFYLKKSNSSTISLCFLSYRRAKELANFLAASAPAPGFFQAAPAPTGSGSPALSSGAEF